MCYRSPIGEKLTRLDSAGRNPATSGDNLSTLWPPNKNVLPTVGAKQQKSYCYVPIDIVQGFWDI